MNALRDAAQALGLRVGDAELAQFQAYYELLLDWNRRVNLTRITESNDVVVRHFLDSLTCLLVMPALADGLRVIDVGSGAGFPGLPLKIVCPTMRLTLVDSVGKKTAFLKAVVAELGLKQVQVLTGRAEDLAHSPEHRQAYDVALSRAVAPLATLVEYCLPFVKMKGRLIAQKTAGIAEELLAASPAIGKLGGMVVETRVVSLPGLQVERLLVVVGKVKATPQGYPRKAGLPAKQPLG